MVQGGTHPPSAMFTLQHASNRRSRCDCCSNWWTGCAQAKGSASNPPSLERRCSADQSGRHLKDGAHRGEHRPPQSLRLGCRCGKAEKNPAGHAARRGGSSLGNLPTLGGQAARSYRDQDVVLDPRYDPDLVEQRPRHLIGVTPDPRLRRGSAMRHAVIAQRALTR